MTAKAYTSGSFNAAARHIKEAVEHARVLKHTPMAYRQAAKRIMRTADVLAILLNTEADIIQHENELVMGENK